jgi:hypothetical protein
VPVLGLLADDDSHDDDDEDLVRITSATRTLVALALGVVVLVVVLTALSGDGSESEGSDEDASSPTTQPSTTESTRRTSTTSRLGVTTTTPSAGLVPGEGMAQLDGFALVALGREGLTMTDLGTGAEVVLEGPPTRGAGMFRLGNQLVSVGSSGRGISVLDLSSGGEWLPLPADETAEGFFQTAGGVLVVGDDQLLAPDGDGALRAWDLPPSVDVFSVVGVAGDRIIVNGHGTVFAVDPDGSIESIADGQATEVRHPDIVVISCGEGLTCAARVLDPIGEVVRLVPNTPEGLRIDQLAVSPDRSVVIAAASSMGGYGEEQHLLRHDGGAEWMDLGLIRYWGIESVEWTADGTTAVWWSPGTNTVEVVGPGSERTSVERSSDSSFDPGATVVVRLEDLSPTWREALGR